MSGQFVSATSKFRNMNHRSEHEERAPRGLLLLAHAGRAASPRRKRSDPSRSHSARRCYATCPSQQPPYTWRRRPPHQLACRRQDKACTDRALGPAPRSQHGQGTRSTYLPRHRLAPEWHPSCKWPGTRQGSSTSCGVVATGSAREIFQVQPRCMAARLYGCTCAGTTRPTTTSAGTARRTAGMAAAGHHLLSPSCATAARPCSHRMRSST
jgi:hypothetical protein